MWFKDSASCTCESCKRDSLIAVKSLSSLQAVCPFCNASFRACGREMIDALDEESAFYSAVSIIVEIERETGITIPDPPTNTWRSLTLRALIQWIQRSIDDADYCADASAVTLSAVAKEFPSALNPPNLEISLLDAIDPNRNYADGYR